jgi:hypothetical protein
MPRPIDVGLRERAAYSKRQENPPLGSNSGSSTMTTTTLQRAKLERFSFERPR